MIKEAQAQLTRTWEEKAKLVEEKLRSQKPRAIVPLRRNMCLGKYRLETRLGRGGYCEVWKARDRVEGIWVALKIPNADINGKRDNQSILKEVRLVARLRHPHIMPVKNAEIINGYAVMATELSVKTLDDCSRPMAPRRIILIMSQVLDGLAHAHAHNLVHCDVTPGNIFLFPNGRTAIGDFGIGIKITGRMKTIDEFGTPGYVAPEQAYGHPTYRSDCFAAALILYEYLTGVLPRWPFTWPPKAYPRLRKKINLDFVNFLKKALSVDPEKRFANAKQMLMALRSALPRSMKKSLAIRLPQDRKHNWKKQRREAFIKRYKRVLPDLQPCVDCGEPVSERMTVCPFCKSTRNRYDDRTAFTHICTRCHKGISPHWNYCPWCYGPGFEPQKSEPSQRISCHANCRHCDGKLMRFMRYCPWCNRKTRKAWTASPFPETCGNCGWSVDSSYFNYCPWCAQRLIE